MIIGDDVGTQRLRVRLLAEGLKRRKPALRIIQALRVTAGVPEASGVAQAGLVIEKATGLAYREVIQERIFAPVGMANSGFLWMDRVYPNVAEGCDPLHDESGNIVGWKRNIYAFPPIGSPDSGAYVTAGDLDRFLRAVIAGKLLSPASTQAFLTPQVPYQQRPGGETRYGYGPVFLTQDDRVIWLQKEGINAGVSAVIRHYPGQNLNVVLLSNLEDGVWRPLKEVHERVIAGDFLGVSIGGDPNSARP